MKIFETPLMNISVFDVEDVITTSNGAEAAAKTALTSDGDSLLGGRNALDANSIVSFNF